MPFFHPAVCIYNWYTYILSAIGDKLLRLKNEMYKLIGLQASEFFLLLPFCVDQSLRHMHHAQAQAHTQCMRLIQYEEVHILYAF